ncbi:fluoride efflux transporter FluC [Bifidobacterium aerophilum]|nr:CrcB family protein [Bifidobacterium aerophilum]
MTDDDLPSLEMPILRQEPPADELVNQTGSAIPEHDAPGDPISSSPVPPLPPLPPESPADPADLEDPAPVIHTGQDSAPPTQEFASTRINASSGHPIDAILGKNQPAPPQIPLAPMKRMQARFNPLADGMLYLVVFVGGFVGTGMRYGLNLALPNPIAPNGFFHAFHPATFVANMCACFIFAALSAYMSQASWIRKRARELTSRGVGMGMCGGFSTLSAMAIEDLTSMQRGQIAGFLFYTLVSFACGLLVAWLGTRMALHLAERRSIKAMHDQMTAGDGSHVVRSSAPGDDYGQPLAGGASVGIEPGAALVPAFEPDPVTDEIPMVADPVRGEAHAQ